jgi:hemerythrin superfamily protein
MATKDTDIRVDVEVLKTQVSTLTKLCEKMDTVIEKLADHQGIIINQIYDDMDRRKQDSDNDIKDLYNKVNDLSKDFSDKIEKTEEKLMEKMSKVYDKLTAHADSEEKVISVLTKYKWAIILSIIVISWLTAHATPDTILKLIMK